MSKAIKDVLREALPGDPEDLGQVGPTIGSGFSVPKTVREGSEFHWFHPPATGTTFLCVLSVDPLWYVGHYHRGRMVACQGQGCEMCAVAMGRQVRYVVCCVDLEAGRKGLFEMGPGPGERLRAEHAKCGSLHGLVLGLSRSARRKNAPIVVDVIREEAPAWARAEESLNVRYALAQTWARAESSSSRGAHSSESS